jgi:hypothetical protein
MDLLDCVFAALEAVLDQVPDEALSDALSLQACRFAGIEPEDFSGALSD